MNIHGQCTVIDCFPDRETYEKALLKLKDTKLGRGTHGWGVKRRKKKCELKHIGSAKKVYRTI